MANEVNRGALMSPQLSAKIYWSLGRVNGEDADESVGIGAELIEMIQDELTATWQRAVDRTRAALANGGGGGSVHVGDTGGQGSTTVGDYGPGGRV